MKLCIWFICCTFIITAVCGEITQNQNDEYQDEADSETTYRTGENVFWAHASSLCHELGMRMVILDSHEKNEKIFNYIKTNTRFALKHFWIGTIRLTKPDGSKEYLWQNTQKQVSYNSWDHHQPSAEEHEECVEIWGGAHRLAWNNIGCNDINGVICEMIN
ncbi:hypothetical protein B566_EDAN005132 [Ephemera danica]|nr:hypothetical protein B566_EDAN005132 [Ephemera danica]